MCKVGDTAGSLVVTNKTNVFSRHCCATDQRANEGQ